MARKKKKIIETMVVSLSNPNLTFEKLLSACTEHQDASNAERTISLHINRDKPGYIIGFVNTTKKSGIPPKHNPDTGEYSPLDIAEGEGLGFSNVFIYDKRYKVLMYEFNKNGCYLSSFNHLLETFIYQLDNEDYKTTISFLPLLRADAYKRMMSMDYIKTLELKIAEPSQIRQEYLDENDAISNAIKTGSELKSDTMEVKFDIQARKLEGMPSQVINKILKSMGRIIDKNETSVIEKLKLTGYYNDPESNDRKKDDIDMIFDRYKKTFDIYEPRIQQDPQTMEKCNSIYSRYLDCVEDFKILEPLK